MLCAEFEEKIKRSWTY